METRLRHTSVRKEKQGDWFSTHEGYRIGRPNKTNTPVGAWRRRLGPALRWLLVISANLIITVSCIGKPRVGGQPPTTASAREAAADRPSVNTTMSAESPGGRYQQEPTLESSPALLATATQADTKSPDPSGRPTEATPFQPERRTTPSYDQALRSGFRSDDDRWPGATRYQLDLQLDLEQATLYGYGEISYTNAEAVALDAIYLRLFPNTAGYGGELMVTDLALDGQQIEPARELQGSALRVPLDPPIPAGTQVVLTLDFTVALPTDADASAQRQAPEGYRQLGAFEDVVALANAYPIVPVYDDEGWNVELAPAYGDAVFSDVAFFDVEITAPATMTLVASGTCAEVHADADETTWSCIAAPMRDFNAVLGEDYVMESREVEGITVRSTFYAEHEEGGAAALDYASQAMRLFNARLGPYPYTELDVVETPTSAGGIEYPGLVVINQSYYDGAQGVSDRMEWVVVHEVLHQWWYALVGNDQVDEPWLDEALVQYCTLLYYEDQYGQDVAASLLKSIFRQAHQQLEETGRDRPVGLPVADYNSSDYGAVVYQKGPLYFHNLRQQVGREVFWEILATYFERHRYRIAQPEDWLRAVEEVTGSAYRSLYDQWIRGAES